MVLVVLARNPTDSVTRGLLPAVHRSGRRVRLLTDDPDAHARTYAEDRADGLRLPPIEIEGCDVFDVRQLLARIGSRPEAVLSNSDHLQTQTAQVAAYLDLPGKDWRSALRARDKGLMRATLAAAGLDDTPFLRWGADDPPRETLATVRYPAVLKPAEGVASEDVVRVENAEDLARRVAAIRTRRSGDLLVEGLLDGQLHTLETMGDAGSLRVLGGYRTTVSPAPYFIEERLTWDPTLPDEVVRTVLEALAALGVGFGPCHTEFILTADGPRIVEVNDRLIGDHCDFAMAELIDEPVFDDVVALHLGGPLRTGRPRSDRHGLLHTVVADRDGVLRSAPDAGSRVLPGADGDVSLVYRPMREPGAVLTVTGTNRDYLGSLQVIGPTELAVETAAEDFLRSEEWVIG